ncbi:MAG TPA: heterodisulfide reductase-related iron-sulfur binding cluster [Acidimicrobiales bacterium]|nr:heterodisulfide reductase-related iron-sulfur binding cluster [Acidimicrobiales bacterium]
MTTTYDPFHPRYFDEADLREEMNRVYDLCHGCRLCFKFCSAFPTLFAAVDKHDDQDSARMTVAEQDQVVDECFNCKLCYVNCPYVPGQHEWALDFPRLMLRAEQVLHRNRPRPIAARLTDQALGRTDLAGKVNTALAPVVNRVVEAPGGTGRRLMAKLTGIAGERVLPPYARQRFSTWWRTRRAARAAADAAPGAREAILFPTCIVEYQSPQIGKDLVRVYERNGIACSLPAGQVCCGAPWLHSGDVDNFRRQGRRNVALLAGAVRAAQARGTEPAIVVPQPTCGYVLKYDYRDYIGGEDAELVARYTADSSEYLMNLHRAEGGGLDVEFGGEVPESVTYHAPCHLRAQNVGLKSRDLVELTGAKVTVVAECSGIDGIWGYREENYEASRRVAGKMAAAIDRAGDAPVVGDCHLANGGILQETGRTPQHPLSTLARAYGIPED